jgi:hypothetical protein
MSSLLKFRPKTLPEPPALQPPIRVKYGLYPMGEEVLVSQPTFEVILHILTNGSPEESKELASVLRLMYNSPFASVTG